MNPINKVPGYENLEFWHTGAKTVIIEIGGDATYEIFDYLSSREVKFWWEGRMNGERAGVEIGKDQRSREFRKLLGL